MIKKYGLRFTIAYYKWVFKHRKERNCRQKRRRMIREFKKVYL